jgi:hypothetical protein
MNARHPVRWVKKADSFMITTVAEFLLQLKDEETRKLDSVELTHAPTIGDMYEGLSKDLLNRAIPESLGLQLVSGFIFDGLGGLSGQIDCMLVKGQGEVIPYTNVFKWNIKDVIAVLEIKKTLNGDDLADAFAHLRVVRDLEANQRESGRESHEIIDVRPAYRAFAETTGIVAPNPDAVSSLSPRDQLILHTLILEHLGSIRVIFGYHGFQTELGFRRSLINLLKQDIAMPGFGVHSFPQLIISGGYSLLKTNGRPFSAPLHDGMWPFYCSASTNPLQLLLEYIWTRLSWEFGIGGLWGDDMIIESPHAFLLATAEERNGKPAGWKYEYVNASRSELAEARNFREWEPSRLSREQFIIILSLCEGRTMRLDDTDVLQLQEESGFSMDQFKQDLLQTRLVAFSGEEIELTTERCQCAILPSGDFVAGEDNSGRFTRWLQRQFSSQQQLSFSSIWETVLPRCQD